MARALRERSTDSSYFPLQSEHAAAGPDRLRQIVSQKAGRNGGEAPNPSKETEAKVSVFRRPKCTHGRVAFSACLPSTGSRGTNVPYWPACKREAAMVSAMSPDPEVPCKVVDGGRILHVLIPSVRLQQYE